MIRNTYSFPTDPEHCDWCPFAGCYHCRFTGTETTERGEE